MLLAMAGFANQAQVHVTGALLPQIAADFHPATAAPLLDPIHHRAGCRQARQLR
jgi:hypothetical protein